MAINPFDNDIVSRPRPTPESVSLNDDILNELILKLETSKNTSAVKQPLKAQLVLSPTPGYGKSHLIGRLFSKLSRRATLVYLTPFVDSATCWKSILRRTIQELKYNDNLDLKFESYTQLEAFAHGILVNLIESGINSGKIRTTTKKAILDFLHNKNILEFRAAKKMLTFVQKNIDGLEKIFINELKKNGIVLNAISASSWFRVLFTYAYLPADNNLTDACLAWLSGEGIDIEEAQRLGIRKGDIPNSDMSSGERNALSKERILDLCMLATFYRPFVFCFDQTENYIVDKDKDLINALGSVIQVLADECYNQMTMITANQHPWGIIREHLRSAYQNRIETLELKGINKQQASELIAMRFRVEGLNDSDKERFIGDGKWLTDIFQQTPEVGARSFIHECKDRFEDIFVEPPPKVTIEVLYKAVIETRKSQPKLLVFDDGILNWLVCKAARGISGLAIDKLKDDRGYFTVLWKLNGRLIYFGFEDGSNVARWQAIAKRAQMLYQKNRNTKVVMIRTHELSPIPGPGWLRIGPLIEAAKRECLHILHLQHPNKDPMIIELYAAYGLYSEAIAGDIAFTPDEMLDDAFVRKTLQRFWDIVLAPIEVAPPPTPQPKPESGKPLSEDGLEGQIRDIVEKARFMHLDELVSKLPPGPSRERCLEVCRQIPQITVTNNPNMVLLRWQPNQ
ncbi:MAG: hypothetical protein HQL05_07915 [Nitrospirae bacterium]|uniref:hypothetical protein n=1 Tax=Candidatus Magnetobacterium casense TaxID=1455061 RepID=UPI00058EB6B5|nr:hypothetical protein [Candidatus Magnetobacterium casensis]MBF0337744.1 hypothetical protein [Nitrospirota bacterium]